MVINFLQTRNPPILPALHQLPHEEYKAQDGTESGFNADLNKLIGFGSANKETIGELLFLFFRLYAYEVDYEASVISVRHGKILSRKEKSWDLASGSKEGQWRLCVEEPFNTTRNLGNSADSTAWRGIHLEIRQAFKLLADGGQLSKACEEYQFPPEEKVTFVKPVSGPRPVLSAVPIQSARNGAGRAGGTRGGRHNGTRNGNGIGAAYNGNGRRSSSASTYQQQFVAPFSPPLSMVGSDYMNQLDAARIQEHLYQQSQQYALQIEQLKQKMLYQHSRIQAAEHHRSVGQHSGHTSQNQSATHSPQKTPYLNRGSSPQMTGSSLAHPEYMYPAGQFFDSQGVSTHSLDGTRTNPSSPSLSTSAPLRRNPLRSPISSDNNGATRSHSQPARGMQQSFMLNPAYPQFSLGPYQAPQYQSTPSRTTSGSQSRSGMETGSELHVSYDPLCRTSSLPVGAPPNTSPKEYLGYYVHHDPRQMPMPTQAQQVPGFSLPPIPPYSDLAHRRNRPSQDLHLSLNGFRPHMSRSPSPLGGGHHRTFSTPVRNGGPPLHSAPLEKVVSRFDRSDVSHPFQTQRELPHVPNGLLIVNGSSYPETVSNPVEDDSSSSVVPDDQNTSYSDRSDIFLQDESNISTGLQNMPGQHPQSGFYHSNGLPLQTFHPETENPRVLYPSPPQAFPAYVDQGLSSSRSIASQEDDHTLSPRSAPWATNFNHRPSIAPIDTSPPVQAAGKNEPKTAPLLSPVYEHRTPSPTAQRRSDSIRQSNTNGVLPLVNGVRAKENVTLNTRYNSLKNEPPPPTPAAKSNPGSAISNDRQGKAPTSNANSGAIKADWQQANAKKKKTRQRARSGPVLGPKAAPSSSKGNGESMPKNDFERKGG